MCSTAAMATTSLLAGEWPATPSTFIDNFDALPATYTATTARELYGAGWVETNDNAYPRHSGDIRSLDGCGSLKPPTVTRRSLALRTCRFTAAVFPI